MQHTNTARGRKVRLNFKKRLTESNEERMKPQRSKIASLPPATTQEDEESIYRQKKKNDRRYTATEVKDQESARRKRRQASTPEGRGRIGDPISRSNLLNVNESLEGSSGYYASKPEAIQSLDDFHLESNNTPARLMNRRSISNPAIPFEGKSKDPFAFRLDSNLSKSSEDDGLNDLFQGDDFPKDEEEYNFMAEGQQKTRPTFSNVMSLQNADPEWFEEEMRSIVAETQRSIIDAFSKHKQQDVFLMGEIKKALLSRKRSISGVTTDDMLAIKEDVQKLAESISAAEVSRLSQEVELIRKELRTLREEQSRRFEPEIQKTLQSVQKMLSNVGDQTGFSLGSKVDQLEAKLSRILSIVVKDKTKVDPQTEAELKDERRRRQEAVKFMEDQVKKFTKQKADYQAQIRQESDKIHRERRSQRQSKDKLRKELSSIDRQNADINDRALQVQKAQKRRKQNMRRGSMLTANDISKLTGQNDEAERLKETISKQQEQVLKVKAKAKNDKKRYQEKLGEIHKEKKRLENEKLMLKHQLSEAVARRKGDARREQDLTTEKLQLEFENDQLRAPPSGGHNAEMQEEDLEKERTYLAKMKNKLEDLAKKLTEERDSTYIAVDLDYKTRNIATQQKLLEAERESLYTEREQFEEERTGFQDSRAEKDESLKEQEKSIKQMRGKLEGQAKIMNEQFPKFKAKLASLEEQEKKCQETAETLKTQTVNVKRQLEELEKKAQAFLKQADIENQKERELAKREKEIHERKVKVEELQSHLTDTRRLLREKQKAFDSLTREFENAAIKKKNKNEDAQKMKIKQVLLEEQTRLRMEFTAERQALKKEYVKREAEMSDQKTLKKKAEKLIQEDKIKLQHEKQRIAYLTKELHSTMNDLEKQKIEFDQEKRNWIHVIEVTINDEALVKEIRKMFSQEKGKKETSQRASEEEKDAISLSKKKSKKKNKSRKK